MFCFFCRREAGKPPKDTKAILCGDCVQRCVGAPDIKPPAPKLTVAEKIEKKKIRVAKKAEKLTAMKSAARGRGRGWHLRRLFEFEGEYFSMGEKIDAAQAARIRKELAKAPITLPDKGVHKNGLKKRGRPAGSKARR